MRGIHERRPENKKAQVKTISESGWDLTQDCFIPWGISQSRDSFDVWSAAQVRSVSPIMSHALLAGQLESVWDSGIVWALVCEAQGSEEDWRVEEGVISCGRNEVFERGEAVSAVGHSTGWYFCRV